MIFSNKQANLLKSTISMILVLVIAFSSFAFSKSTAIFASAATLPFSDLPDYPDGSVSPVYNAGPGLANDKDNTTSEDSNLVVIKSTTKQSFTSYVASVLASGFTQVSQSDIDNNTYYSFKKDNKLYYMYYTDAVKEVRIIEDKSTNIALSQLDTDPLGNGKTELYLYSIDYTRGGGQTTNVDYFQINCGALLIIKLADNSLYVIDSGHERQASIAAQEGLLDFMYEITGIEKTEKINIRSWFFSHAHGDHVFLAHAFIQNFHDKFTLGNVMYNIPSFRTMGGGYDSGTFLLKDSINEHFPNTTYSKLHTGEKFDLQGVQFEVLYTHEDAVDANTGRTTISNFNDTSTIFKFYIDGKSFMMLGDGFDVPQTVMLRNLSSTTMKSDVVQTAHHNYNLLPNLYNAIKAPIALFNNSPENAGPNSGNKEKYDAIKNAVNGNLVSLYADPKTYKIYVENDTIKYDQIDSYRDALPKFSLKYASSSLLGESKGKRVSATTVKEKESLFEKIIDKTITGTATTDVNQPPYYLFDNRTTTNYTPASNTAILGWAMKEPTTLTSYVLFNASGATNCNTYPSRWILTGSNDGTNYDVIDAVNSPIYGSINLKSIAFDVADPKPYKFYNIRVFDTVGDNAKFKISEIGLYTGTTNIVDSTINLINDLPTVEKVTTADEAIVKEIQSQFNTLSEEQKAQVTNSSKITDLLNKIDTLNQTTSIVLNVYGVNLKVDQSSDISAFALVRGNLSTDVKNNTFTFTSSNPNVVKATVKSDNKTATLTGVAPGTATIKVQSTDGSTVFVLCNITVTPKDIAVSSVKLPSKGSLTVGATTQLKATVSPTDATNKIVKWTSSNKKVATVSSSGKITAKGLGTATITATAGGRSANYTLKVGLAAPSKLKASVAKSKVTVSFGKSKGSSYTYITILKNNKTVINKKISASKLKLTLKKGKYTVKIRAYKLSGGKKYYSSYVTKTFKV